MRSRTLILLLLVGIGSQLPGLDLERGKIKVSIAEKTGRIAVWGTVDAVNPQWSPLYSVSDTSTTKWKLQLNGRGIVLGDDNSFPTLVESIPTGARVSWHNKAFDAVLLLQFLTSQGSDVADGLQWDWTLTNSSDSTSLVGLRWVLDTNLGEKKDHFVDSAGNPIRVETKWENPLSDSWTSTSGNPQIPGLRVMVGKGSTSPDAVYFANWKRLDESSFEPSFKEGRDFNNLPYSFNDSAVATVFKPVSLQPGQSRTLTVQLGLSQSETFEGAQIGSANPLADQMRLNVQSGQSPLDQELQNLTTLLSEIDKQIANPKQTTAEEIRMIQGSVKEIETRVAQIEEFQP